MVNWYVACLIEGDSKRVEKIQNARIMSRHYGIRGAMHEKAERFVVAECREKRIKLSAQDIYDTAYEVYHYCFKRL